MSYTVPYSQALNYLFKLKVPLPKREDNYSVRNLLEHSFKEYKGVLPYSRFKNALKKVKAFGADGPVDMDTWLFSGSPLYEEVDALLPTFSGTAAALLEGMSADEVESRVSDTSGNMPGSESGRPPSPEPDKSSLTTDLDPVGSSSDQPLEEDNLFIPSRQLHGSRARALPRPSDKTDKSVHFGANDSLFSPPSRSSETRTSELDKELSRLEEMREEISLKMRAEFEREEANKRNKEIHGAGAASSDKSISLKSRDGIAAVMAVTEEMTISGQPVGYVTMGGKSYKVYAVDGQGLSDKTVIYTVREDNRMIVPMSVEQKRARADATVPMFTLVQVKDNESRYVIGIDGVKQGSIYRTNAGKWHFSAQHADTNVATYRRAPVETWSGLGLTPYVFYPGNTADAEHGILFYNEAMARQAVTHAMETQAGSTTSEMALLRNELDIARAQNGRLNATVTKLETDLRTLRAGIGELTTLNDELKTTNKDLETALETERERGGDRVELDNYKQLRTEYDEMVASCTALQTKLHEARLELSAKDWIPRVDPAEEKLRVARLVVGASGGTEDATMARILSALVSKDLA